MKQVRKGLTNGPEKGTGRASAETTVSACATQLYIRIDNLDTSEYLSKMLGETTIELKRASLRRGGILGSKTIDTDYDAVPLRTPQQLRQMDPRKIILLVSSAPPFELERVIYHDDRPYRQALEQVRFKSVNVPELEAYAEQARRPEALAQSVTGNASTQAVALRAATPKSALQPLSEAPPNTQSMPANLPSSPGIGQIATNGLPVPAWDRVTVPANQSAVPLASAPTSEALPIEAALALQMDAGAAAFRRVMDSLPEGGEHQDLLGQYQQMTTLHQEFGDDAPPSGSGASS